ncbi:DnaT DNA-binding domain protein [compost metagenome]
MFADWQPDEVSLRVHLRTAGLTLDDLDGEQVAEFVGFWLTRPTEDTHAGWCRRLVQQVARRRAQAAASPAPTRTADWAAEGVRL